MAPVLFEFQLFDFPFVVHGYGLMVGLAVVAWCAAAGNEAKRTGNDRLVAGNTVTCLMMIAAAYLGGKGLYWLTQVGQPDAEIGDGGTGFVFYGAVLLCIPTLVLRGRMLGVSPWTMMDIFAVGTPLGHAIGRVGCFLAGCCYGHRCDGPLAMEFPDGDLVGVAIHPVQLYEAVGNLAVWAWLYFRVRHRARFTGQTTVSYLLAYAVLRTITESFRGDPWRRFVFIDGEVGPGDPPLGISTSVFIAAVMAVGTLIALIVLVRRQKSGDR